MVKPSLVCAILFLFFTQAFCGAEKGLELQWFLVTPKSCLPLPPSGLMTNWKPLRVALNLFLLFLLLLMKKDFLKLATASKFSMLKVK